MPADRGRRGSRPSRSATRSRPRHRYPTPVRQALAALAHLQANAARLGLDAERIVLAGDSAGAQIAAQVGADRDPTPATRTRSGSSRRSRPGGSRGVVLACGPFDLSHATGGAAVGTRFMTTALWAYSGRRRFADDPGLALASVVDHLTDALPPTFVTVGNADSLRVHSEALAERLAARGVEVDALFWPDGHEPPLGHEYQFDLDSDAGRVAFERMLAFSASGGGSRGERGGQLAARVQLQLAVALDRCTSTVFTVTKSACAISLL